MIPDDDPDFIENVNQFEKSFIAPLFPELRIGLWHTTSLQGYLGIQLSGFIEPNNGKRPFTYPQTENSYGFCKGYVCMFDFGGASENECIAHHPKWLGFFCKHSPFTIAIQLDKAKLSERLIENQVAWEEVGCKKMWIPYVEVWHDGPIPISVALGYWFVPHDSPGKMTYVAADDPQLKYIVVG